MATLNELTHNLETLDGLNFQNAVAEAFNFLGLKAEVIPDTNAESDVIIEAAYSEHPYYVVVECCAVAAHNQVPYDKLGQIRGNFTKYMDERRQRLFKTAYKLIVGRPEFSNPAKTNSEPDVGLLKVSVLTETLKQHTRYHFSQDELEKVFKMVGEIRSDHLVNSIVQTYLRRVNIYALVYISLLEDPYSPRPDARKPYTPMEQIVGEIKAYAKLLRIPALSDNEVNIAIRDLFNPFLKFVDIRETDIRLVSLPTQTIETTGGQLGHELTMKIQEYLGRLRQMQNLP